MKYYIGSMDGPIWWSIDGVPYLLPADGDNHLCAFRISKTGRVKRLMRSEYPGEVTPNEILMMVLRAKKFYGMGYWNPGLDGY